MRSLVTAETQWWHHKQVFVFINNTALQFSINYFHMNHKFHKKENLPNKIYQYVLLSPTVYYQIL